MAASSSEESLERNTDDAADAETSLIKNACDYLTSGTYPPGATKNKKRVIRKKASKLSVRNGEIFYKKKGRKEVSYYYDS